jgi:transcriptional regulator with XRE-family HTH domain
MTCTDPNTAKRSCVFIPAFKHAGHLLSTPLDTIAPSMAPMTMGKRIREAREGAGLSIQQLAKKAGVSRSAVYQWESGDTKGLKPENLFAVAAATGYAARWIGTDKGTKRESPVLGQDGLDLGFLTTTLEAVEKYLDEQELALQPEAKAKLVAILYETCASKGKVEEPTVARYLRLVA